MLPRKPQLSTHLEDHDPDAVTTSSPLSAGSSAVPINMSGSGAGPISPSEARAGSTQGPSSRGYFSPPSRPVGAGGPRSASHGRPTSATHSHRGSPIHSPSTMSSPGTTSPHGHPLSRSSSRASEATLSPIMYPIDDDRSTGSSRPSSATVSRHPSFSFHGLEGKGSTGVAGDRPDYSEAKIVVAMVGLPARGKSYLSNKLQRYLRWLEYEVKVFNVGQYRREKYRERAKLSGKKEDQSAHFFDSKNTTAHEAREGMAADCLESLIHWLKHGGNVGIHDATNTTRARREKIAKRVAKERGLKLIFLESICTDPAVIAANIAVKVASGDPDYDGMDASQAEKDFRARIKHYEDSYEPIDPEKEERYTFCKVVNVGYEVTVNRIDGYLTSRIAFYLMNLHVTPRSIFFTRHGESQYNVEGKIGGDSYLSERGEQYAKALPQLVSEAIGDTPLTVWTSTLKRTIQTASGLKYPQLTWKSLDELDAGVCDGMTYEDIEEHYPEDYAARDDDKFNYRYRGGESYRDVVVRLEPVIMELERQGNILIVCHQAVLRCLYAYFHNLSQDELPYIKIPLHTVIKLTPKAYGCDETRYSLPIEAVDTTRPKPLKVKDAIKTSGADEGVSPSTQPPKGKRPFYI